MNKNKVIHCTMAFGIPVILFGIVMVLNKVYPFGDLTLLIWDADGQYSAFLAAVRRMLLGEDDIFYTLGKILGGSTAGLLAYYGTSPLNLFLLLFPENRLIDGFHFLVLLKIGLCGLTSFYALNKVRCSGLATLIFSSAYALMGYVSSYFWNVMWLDGVILLPLIAIGIKKLLEDRTPFLYIFSLGFALLSQYYIGYMLCIFSVLWFAFLLSRSMVDKKAIRPVKACVRFAFASLLAGALAGVVLLPAFFSLNAETGNAIEKLFSIKRRFPLSSLATKFFTGAVSYDELRKGLPNLYVSIPTIALFSSYVINRSIPRTHRILSAGLIGIFFLSFQVESLYLLWHGMDRPNAMPARFSFLFSFILIWLAYESFVSLKQQNQDFWARRMGYTAIGLFVAVSLLFSSELPQYLAYETLVFDCICFLCSCGLIVWLSGSKRRAALLILFVIECVGLVANGYFSIHRMNEVGDLSAAAYQQFSAKRQQTIDKLEEYDSGLYRIDTNAYRAENDPLTYGYAGISHYSSDFDPDFIGMIRSLGVYGSHYRTQYGAGAGPVLESLFGIKYIIYDEGTALAPVTSMYQKLWEESETVDVWNNPYALPLAFCAPVSENKIIFGENPFENQNLLIRDLSGVSTDVFQHVKVSFSVEDEIVTGKFTQFPNASMYLRTEGSWFSFNNNAFEGLERFNGCILLPEVESIKQSQLSAYMGVDARAGGMYVSIFNQKAFEAAFERLHQNACTVKSDTASRFGIQTPFLAQTAELILTLPYDEGWQVKVDGNNADASVRCGLLAVPLDAGAHTIELVFRPKGLHEGIAVTVGAAAVVFLWILLRNRSCVKRKAHS